MTRRVFVVSGWLIFFYLIVYVDVVLRARDAYLKAEQASSAQMAYVWYETAATLFTPPESKWSRMAREKMPEAKARWKAELQAKGVRFDDAMLD